MFKRHILGIALLAALSASQAEAHWFYNPYPRQQYVYVDQPMYAQPHPYYHPYDRPVYVDPIYVDRPVYVDHVVVDNRDPGVAVMQDGFNLMFNAMSHSKRKRRHSRSHRSRSHKRSRRCR